MNPCPFCSGKLYPTFTGSLPREKCSKCNSLWFEGEALENVVGRSAVTALVQRTRGKPGKCKHCAASLAHVAECPRCGKNAPTCPQCNTAPLAVAMVHTVRVDVCTGCKGMALDAPGLEELQKLAAERLPPKPTGKPKVDISKLTKAPCAACQRKLLLKHSFTYDSKLYCGSCAPSGAAPYNVELARSSPTLASTLDNYLVGNEDLAKDAVSLAVTWVFKSAAGHLLGVDGD
jgi:Zn-finger nucleic acid-binding protein